MPEDIKKTIISNFIQPPGSPDLQNYPAGRFPKEPTTSFQQAISQGKDILTRAYLSMVGSSPEQVQANNQAGQAYKNIIPAPAGIAYHGSPAIFENFNPEFIGSGEGAQAFGHGLYFAENPKIAENYRRNLTGGSGALNFTKEGKTLDPNVDNLELLREYFKPGNVIKSYNGQDRVVAFHETPEQPWQWSVSVRDINPKTGKEGPLRVHSTTPKSQNIEEVLTSQGWKANKPGATYTVDIPDEHVAKMIDWDKPLIKQNPEVLKAIDKSGILAEYEKYNPDFKKVVTGEGLYRLISTGGTPKAGNIANKAMASEYLNSIGIPGIKYFDAFSRKVGEGSRNLVVFDPSIIKMLKRD